MGSRVSPTDARFTAAAAGTGMYESWYARLVSPDGKLAVWIRYTIDKVPGEEATGTIWFTLFDREAERPAARRQSGQPASAPVNTWVRIGDSTIGPAGLHGECFEAEWQLRFEPLAPVLFHLPRPRFYELPLPKTKPISPVPLGDFNGTIRFGDRKIKVDGWRGMIGHNWGTEHAERWIWLHGSGFTEDPEAWIDVAMGRILVAGRLLPWVANGAIHSEGRIRRIGGMFAPGVNVNETPLRLEAGLPVAGKGYLELEIDSPPNLTVGWQYGDPADPQAECHEVANCSAARMSATLTMPGHNAVTHFNTAGGAVYELGMTETDHGIPIADGFPPGHSQAPPE
ncbi:MAG: hypothetical protein KDB52_11060 [Solirubrobacterales bacterium]|nr:hypothetical protein [Solirubrobacterales bacterium]